MVPCKALITVVFRTDAVETAVEELGPRLEGIVSGRRFQERIK